MVKSVFICTGFSFVGLLFCSTREYFGHTETSTLPVCKKQFRLALIHIGPLSRKGSLYCHIYHESVLS